MEEEKQIYDAVGQNANIEHELADDAMPLCPQCLKPCDPLNYYCPNCGSNEAVNPLSTYMPFVELRFNTGMAGKAWRRLAYDKDTSLPNKTLSLIAIVATYPLLLVLGIPQWVLSKFKAFSKADISLQIVLYIIALLVTLAFCYFILYLFNGQTGISVRIR